MKQKKPKKWETTFRVEEVQRAREWGPDHPLTGTMQWCYVVLDKNGNKASKRWYSGFRDAQRGAAQIYNYMEKKLLG